MTDPALHVESLSRYFKNVAAVKRLTLTVQPGEIVGLLGPNGAGKTTALRCIAGLLKPGEGSIRIAGIDAARQPIEAKRQVAYVPEVPSPYDLLTVEEQLLFVARAFGIQEPWPRLNEMLERFDLTEKRRELCVGLSKGMKQKLALACAFIRDPALYLLDEPLIGIDPRGARELKDLIAQRASSGAAVVVSTHMLDTAERLATRIIILNRGEVLAEGTLDQLNALARMREDTTLEDVFLKLTEESETPSGRKD